MNKETASAFSVMNSEEFFSIPRINQYALNVDAI